MPLTLYGLHDRPHNIAATKVGADVADCVFLLDFSRPLERVRWFGIKNRWWGLTLGLFVPVVHQAEEQGGYIISVHRSEPYFADIPKLWKQHRGMPRTISANKIGALDVIADFARHFPQDCQEVTR